MDRLSIAALLLTLALGFSSPACTAAPPPVASQEALHEGDLRLPLEANSTRFAVIGDSGTGDRDQLEVARLLNAYREKVHFETVIMLGDNIYGGHSASDFQRKFERPYKALKDAGVKFYASLGNHDDPNAERLYKPFNMNGERYYTFKKNDVAFFVLDSNYMDAAQLDWLRKSLEQSKERWKIAYFHHPLFNSGKSHGPDTDLRVQLMPLFTKYGVNAVFSGHEHVYERIRPVENIHFFVLGNSGKLMRHDLRNSDEVEKSFDTDRGFMIVEISGDKLYFQVISRSGETIDSGSFERQPGTSAASGSR